MENREVKSDVFSMLMEDKRYALEVYNALNDSDYDDPELVNMTTLKKGISLTIRNDASFIVDMDMNIYEHQSTYNPNMPLRSVIYFTDVLKPLLKDQDLFGRKLIKIPTPRFVVFYNGVEDRPIIETLKLSDAFENKTKEPQLEVICTVYNINPGKNDDFLGKCSIMNQYTAFVEKVRDNQRAEIENPIEEAIEWCKGNNVLKEFLTSRKEEVLKAMTLDMTWEHREEMIRRDERAEGREEGLLAGKEQQRRADEILIEAKDAEIADKDARIAELEALLAENK